MATTPRSTQPAQTPRLRGEDRLRELEQLIKLAEEGAPPGKGFLDSLDEETLAAFLASDDPEIIGRWPE